MEITFQIKTPVGNLNCRLDTLEGETDKRKRSEKWNADAERKRWDRILKMGQLIAQHFFRFDEDYRSTHPGCSMSLKQRNTKNTPSGIKKMPPKTKGKKKNRPMKGNENISVIVRTQARRPERGGTSQLSRRCYPRKFLWDLQMRSGAFHTCILPPPWNSPPEVPDCR